MRVLIACNDPGVTAAFADALRRAGIRFISAPPDAAATLALVQRQRFDVVLLDDKFPGLGGVPGLQKLAIEARDSRVVCMADRYEAAVGVPAVLAGAAGYLDRQIPPAALPRVLRAVMRGEAAIPRSMTMAIVELARNDVGMRPVRSALTAREWEVLDLMTMGASTQAISKELVVSLETVQSHIKHILRKFRVHSRTEAIARAQELRGNRSTPN
jgi:two-component system, NarL family, response regulator LiaR